MRTAKGASELGRQGAGDEDSSFQDINTSESKVLVACPQRSGQGASLNDIVYTGRPPLSVPDPHREYKGSILIND